MRKFSVVEMIPDSKRENLDFLGQVRCPIKDRFSRAWNDFEGRYNAGHANQIRGVVPIGGCGVDVYCNISTVEAKGAFPLVVTDTGYGEFFTGSFLSRPEKCAWFDSRPVEARPHPLFRGHSLKDPRGLFHLFGAMPYVLMVHHRRLGGRPVPRRIGDLSSGCYRGSVGTGFAEDDVSELLLLELWKEQGEAGIRGLARNIAFTGRVPQMAKDITDHREGCCVYFISWFFAHAIPKRDYLEIIWPEDGAVLNPLYALFKKGENDREAETLEACASFLFGRDLAQTMADGYFAHIHAETRHPLPPEARFRWAGWDYLLEEPLTHRVGEIERVYYDERSRRG